jgi:Rrf2 family protein
MVDTRFSVSVQIMVTLAYHSDELMSSSSLSKVFKTNPTFIRKLVSNLVKAKLVKSFRGKDGGIKIARPATEITLKDIYVASTDDKTLVSAHKKPTVKACPVSCNMDKIFSDIVEGIESSTKSFLAKKYLSDILKVCQKGTP